MFINNDKEGVSNRFIRIILTYQRKTTYKHKIINSTCEEYYA